ncbi:MAG: hypothetical protein IJX88_00230 [Clostridia bacterium]|nr:hypothetical protein [Clostridia bacterium]
MQYTISNGNLTVTADTLGAEIISVKKNGKEWVWQNQDGNWDGHGPLLFPVCGHFGLTVDGVFYDLPAHGFSRKSQYTLVDKGEDFLIFELRANEQTKAVYPFDFVVTVGYALTGDTLTIRFEVENPAEKTLYFACGGHESFNLDKNIGNYELRFEKTEHLVHLYHNDDGYLDGKTLDYGVCDTFVLPEDFLQEGRTLIFKDINSRKLTFAKKGGEALVEVAFDGFKNLLLWRELDSPFLCIEPWSNLPDYENAPDVEFSTKEGVFAVAPKDKKSLVRTIKYL